MLISDLRRKHLTFYFDNTTLPIQSQALVLILFCSEAKWNKQFKIQLSP